jgi:hypothetical protein
MRSLCQNIYHGVFNLWISPFMTCVRLLEDQSIVNLTKQCLLKAALFKSDAL